MDQSFQKEAFCALNDNQKKELLNNARLKDELALQGIGLSNLLVRLHRSQ
jgi:hypothetical protein